MDQITSHIVVTVNGVEVFNGALKPSLPKNYIYYTPKKSVEKKCVKRKLDFDTAEEKLEKKLKRKLEKEEKLKRKLETLEDKPDTEKPEKKRRRRRTKQEILASITV